MNRARWDEIAAAAKLLELGETASLAEIKSAFHRLSKQHHPDTTDERGETADSDMIRQLIEAYEVLTRYCAEYRFPLTPGEDDITDAEDWWMERFGEDPLWGKKKRP